MKNTSKLLLALFVFSGIVFLASPAEAAVSKKVVGNLVFWDQQRGFQDIQQNVGLFSEISAHWYTVDASGAVIPYLDWSGKPYVDQNIITYLHANNIAITASIQNANNGVWNGPMISQIINSPTLAANHIASIVAMTVNNGYDGANIDYEELQVSDRTAFSMFIQNLAAALHAKNKILAVDVNAKTSEPGDWDGPQSQDWQAIGSAADQVRIMIYGYSWSTSAPGPLAPIGWVDSVLAFAVTQIPANKIIQGIPTYGNDWPTGSAGTEFMWDDLLSKATQYGSAINFDTASASPWFVYTASGNKHTVWFENAKSTDAKLALANQYNIGGISIWRISGEDPATWQAIASRFGGTITPVKDIQSPTVTITEPAAGIKVAKNQRISVTATDNVGVTKVMIYVDNTLLATDTSAPFTASWITNHVTPGNHSIKAVAYDAAGNTGTSQVTVSVR